MKKIIVILVTLSLSIFNIGNRADEDALIITTIDNKNAIITFETSEFKDNMFTVTIKMDWVNKKLKSVKKTNTVLSVDKKLIEVYPSKSVNVVLDSNLTMFSNEELKISFFANPKFEGGDIEVMIPLVSAETKEKGEMGLYKEVLYSQPKKLYIKYNIDGKKIIDLYPPEVEVNFPIADDDDLDDYGMAVVETKKTEIKVSVYDKNEVKSVKINGKKAKLNMFDEYSATITLYTGHNIVKIEAVDNVGNKIVHEHDVLCTYQYDLDLKGGTYYALLIGVSQYDDFKIHDLKYPVSDVADFKKALLNYTFEEENIHTLENPTRAQIIDLLEAFANTLNERDNLIIFYAGHGFWDAYKEIGYWIPADADLRDKSNWLRNSTIKDYIGAIKSQHTLLITDACFSGSIFQTRNLESGQVVAYQKIYDMPSRKGMTSGTLKEVPDKSVFLSTLIKRLNQNEDKYLPASKLFNSMRDAILNNSPNVPQYGTIQGVGDEGGEFIFIKK